jgi:hypothetical protein
MYSVSFLTIFIVIIIVIIFIVVISSLSYNSEDNDISTKTLNENKELKPVSDIMKIFIKPAQKYRSNYFDTTVINKNVTYMLKGNFSQACVSIYDITDEKEDRIYSKIFNGKYNILLGSNLNIISPIIKENKNKSTLCPLELNKKYRIVFNNSSEMNIVKYLVNYDISYKEIIYEYPESIGLNEYDLELYFRKNGISNLNLKESDITRLYPKNSDKYNTWEIVSSGKHAIVLVKNIYNYKINDESYSKNFNSPEIEIKYVDDINFKIENLDFVEDKKDINTEYIDFITSPKFLVNKFLYGSDTKKINYTYSISSKILIYKLK